MSKTLDLTKPVQTKSGLNVRILCIDAPGNQPVVGVFTNGSVRKFSLDGTFLFNKGDNSEGDLMNVPVTVRVYFYETTTGEVLASTLGLYTHEQAMKWGKRHICIKDIVLDT